jgi:hypothetical protein
VHAEILALNRLSSNIHNRETVFASFPILAGQREGPNPWAAVILCPALPLASCTNSSSPACERAALDWKKSR